MSNPNLSMARRMLLLVLLLLVTLATPLARATNISAETRVLCPKPGDAPDNNGPKDFFGRPTMCVSGTPIFYSPTDPIPAQSPVIQGGGAPDPLRVQSNLFTPPVRLDGRPTWSWVGPVAIFPNGDIAYTVSNDSVWGEQRVKIIRPVMTGGELTFTWIYEGIIDGRDISDLVVGDINGDGKADMAVIPSDDSTNNVIGQRGLINIFWGESSNNTSFTRVSFEADNTPDSAALAPISNGRSALGVMNWNSNVFQTFSPHGTRAFTQTNFVGVQDQAGWDNTTVGDINGDGKADFLALIGQYYLNPYFRSFRGDGQGAFVEGQSVYPPAGQYENPSVFMVTDTSGDGKDDVVILSHGNYNPDLAKWGSRLKIFKQISANANGDTISTTPDVSAADDIPSSVNKAKISCEDNVPDLAVVSAGWYRDMWFKGLAGGGFDRVMRLEPHTIYVNGSRPNLAKMQDFNGDGWADEIFSADFLGLQIRLHRPCVEIVKTAPVQVNLGDNFTYTISVTNTGLLPVQGMVISDVLPANLINPIVSNGTVSGRSYTSASFDLAPGQTKSVTIRVTTTVVGTLSNSAVACAKGACTEKAIATTRVVSAPASSTLAVTNVAVNPTTTVGGSFIHRATISNNGAGSSTVVLAYYLTDNTNGAQITAISEGTLQANGHTVSDSFTLLPHSSRIISMTMKALKPGSYSTDVSACSGGSCAPITEATTIVANPNSPYTVQFDRDDYSVPMGALVTATLTLSKVPTRAVDVPVTAFASVTDLNTNPIGRSTVHFNVGEQTKQFVLNVGSNRTPLITIRVDVLVDQSVVTYGARWKARVHRAAVEAGIRYTYLPLVMLNKAQPEEPECETLPYQVATAYSREVDPAKSPDTIELGSFCLDITEPTVVRFASTPDGSRHEDFDDRLMDGALVLGDKSNDKCKTLGVPEGGWWQRLLQPGRYYFHPHVDDDCGDRIGHSDLWIGAWK